MNPLALLVDLGDAAVRRAGALAVGASVLASIPLAVVAFVLVRAARGAIPHLAFEIAADAVVASVIIQIPLARAAARGLRRALEERGEAVRIEVIEHLRLASARSLAALDPGQTLAVMTLGIDDAIAIVVGAFDSICGGLLRAFCAVAIVAAVDWRIALVSLGFLPIVGAYLRASRKISSRAMPRLVRARAEGMARFFEYVESIALLRAFGCTAERMRRLGLAVTDLNVKAFENAVAPLTFGVVSLFFIEFGFAITMTIGVQIGGGSAGVLYIVAMTIALAYFQTLFGALDGYLRLRDAAANLRAVQWLLALPVPPAETTVAPHEPELVLDRISFAYDRGDVLHDVSLRFPQRAVTAIVGKSGAGKSALAGVIAGLWDPYEGAARVGGVDIGALAPAARTKTLAMVFQDTQLYEDTIANNILAGAPGASAERARWARRLRYDRARRRHELLARRAATHRDRADAALGRADRRARRVHGQPRCGGGTRGPRGDRRARREQDRHPHDPPPRPGDACRPHRGHGRRPHRPNGHARRTRATARRVRRTLVGPRAGRPLEGRQLGR